jgi:hypothetical protein
MLCEQVFFLSADYDVALLGDIQAFLASFIFKFVYLIVLT